MENSKGLLFIQLKDEIINSGFCQIKRNKEKQANYYRRNGNVIEQIDRFRPMCMDMFKNYLNATTLEQIRASNDTSIAIGNITISLEVLEAASKSGFTLVKEVKEFLEFLKYCPDFIRSEKDFLPKPGQFPVQNGVIEFSLQGYKLIPNGENTVFFSRINANYSEKMCKFPSLFIKIIGNGIYNPALTKEENVKRLNSILDYFAYLLIPDNPLCKFFWICGATQAGKSKLMEILRIIFGKYAIEVESTTITKHNRTNPDLRPDLFNLAGKILIVCSETENSKKIDSRLIKTITGGDLISVRTLNTDTFSDEKVPGKIFVVSNYPPNFVNPDDEAIRERVVVIDWHNTVAPDERIHDLVERLTTPEMREMIFSALVHRAKRLIRDGKVKLNPNTSFQYNPPQKPLNVRDLQQQAFDRFCEECLIVMDISTPQGFFNNQTMYPYMGRDIFKVYFSYCISCKYPQEIMLRERAFLMKFGEYIKKIHEEYPHVEKVRYSNGNFYRGFDLPQEMITWPLAFPFSLSKKPIGISPGQ
jgi:phage/plasmid-associated DNA primase